MSRRCRFAIDAIKVLLFAEMLAGVCLYMLGVFAWTVPWAQEIVLIVKHVLVNISDVWRLSALIASVVISVGTWFASVQRQNEPTCLSELTRGLAFATLLPLVLTAPLI